jgi:hypothetical protein
VQAFVEEQAVLLELMWYRWELWEMWERCVRSHYAFPAIHWAGAFGCSGKYEAVIA